MCSESLDATSHESTYDLERLQSLDAFTQLDEPSASEEASGSTLMQFCYGYQHVKELSGS